MLERRGKGGPVAVNAYRLAARPGPDGKQKAAPVALTGDIEIELEVPAGETKGPVTLAARVFDPDGGPIHYSWTAPGIEFDDPTSPTPTGIFPLGETIVYLVVRDGAADDVETLESAPALVRMTVREKTSGTVCGDSNGDRGVDIGDPIYVLAYLFAHGPAPSPLSKADVNGSGAVDIADAIYLLSYLFAHGQVPICPL